jgi:hypothetical protein
MVPQLEGEVCIGRAETTDEVVFERLDGAFGGICAMIVGFDKLDLSIAGFHEGLDCGRCLVVSNGKGGFETMRVEAVIDRGESVHDVFSRGGFDGDCKNVIRIVCVGHEEELLAV